MKRFVRLLAALVRRSPWAVLASAIALTVFFGAFLPQQEMSTGNEGFSPDSPEFLAFDVISEYFSDNSEEPVQVVLTSTNGDLLTAAALRDYIAIQDAVRTSEAAPLLKNRPGGDFLGFFDPLVQGLQAQADEVGTTLDQIVAGLGDDDVKGGYLDSLERVPEEFRAQFVGLLGSDTTDLSVPKAEVGLMVVFLNVADLDDPDQTILQEIEVDMADAIQSVEMTGAEGTAFSFALLFADTSEFEAEIGRLFGTAFLIIIVILLFVYWIHPKGRMTRRASLRRALADMGLTMLVIVMSIVWMNGAGVLLGPKYLGIIGNFSEVLQILPILLIGLGVDYAIHTTSRYREELGAGKSVGEAASRAATTVGIALVLATLTTSIGFLTNAFNPITAIADFGILAAVGITAAFILMLTVVPSIRVILDGRAEGADRLAREAFGHQSERLLPKIMGATSVLAERFAATTLVVALLLGGAGVAALTQLDTTFSFTDFLPEDAPLLETFDLLTEEFGGGVEETEVIIEGDVATPEVHNGLVAAWGNLAGVENVRLFGTRAAAESPVSVVAQLVVPPDQGGNPETYDAGFAETAAGLGLLPDLTVAPDADVAGLYRAALAAAPDAMRRVVAEVDGTLRFVDVGVSTTAGEAGALELADAVNEAFEPVTASGATAVATNQNIVSQGVARALQESQASSLAITLLAAMGVLVLSFWIESRRPLLGVITILPVALVVLWVFGIMAARGIPFNPVTAMIANLAIGIGVPYTIHITHRYQEDRIRYDTPDDAIRSTTTHTGGALAGSAFTTAAGFGILITSTLKPFQQFGEVTFWAIIIALVGSVFVLPSLLVLWDRWHRNRGESVVDVDAVHATFDDVPAPEGVPGA